MYNRTLRFFFPFYIISKMDESLLLCVLVNLAVTTRGNDVIDSIFTIIKSSSFFWLFLYDVDVILVDTINFYGITKFDESL